jgi:2-dehydro-3-deoxyphosphogluconate aldolase/(4S)-4-hydroxy-2-oxoglutarate aldolase
MRAGSAAVKVFPAARMGPGYIKDLLGPYPDAALVVSGGIHAGNAAEYLAAGAIAATAGSGVVSPELAAGSRLADIRLRAAEFVAAVRNQS